MNAAILLTGDLFSRADLALGNLFAAVAVGAPVDGAIGFQPAVSTFAASLDRFHDLLLIVITLVTVLVATLLVVSMWRFSARRNPVPASFSHNSLIEVIWTAVPIMILLLIAIPSFPLLYKLDTKPTETTDARGNTIPLEPEDWLTVKTYGRQWYWSYIYPDGSEEPVEFDSFPVPDEDLIPGQLRNLSVDYPMVVPAGKHVNLLVAASDVIHAWAMPSFRLKTDAIPGRLNELWFRVDEPGVYYGQCSELCGIRHAFMPIEVRVIPEAEYAVWNALAKKDIDKATEYLNTVQPLTPGASGKYATNTLN